MKALVDQFEDHIGPIRGVHFHISQPLFVSGGDDKKIKVWNYMEHRCLFTLLGHFGSVNTVQFHHELPWIISASNDYNIRVWNWLSRKCISVLTGHYYEVTSASFHPKEDLAVSASLDRTVRVWDIGFLRKNFDSHGDEDVPRTNVFFDGINGAKSVHVLDDHLKGAVCAVFHPTLPLVLSGGMDTDVILWKMKDQKTWEEHILSLHQGNVSCVVFHPRQNAFSSSSEDKNIILWDVTKPSCLGKLHWPHDKLWVLDSHPKKNLVAAGHDSGMFIYKLGRDRPTFYVSGDFLYYIKDHSLCSYEYSTKKYTQMISIIEPGTCFFYKGQRTLACSPSENAVLISSSRGDDCGSSYELYVIHKEDDVIGNMLGNSDSHEGKRGKGGSTVFVNRNRFVVLEKNRSNHVFVKNLKNETVDEVALPFTADAIFCGGSENLLLCRSEDRLIMFNLQQRNVVGELPTLRSIKYVVWAKDMENVSLVSKLDIIIASKKLVHLCTLHETNHVKSWAWDDNGVFIYTTPKHMKYYLPNGETGIIKTLDVPVYITTVIGSIVYCLDGEGNIFTIDIDATEYVFKLLLFKENYDQARSLMKMKNSKLCGQAIIEYLQQKGFPDLALDFIKDERSRFNLAMEIGNIQVAIASAKEIDHKDYWLRLGVAALRHGHASITEYAYQRAKSFDKLAFFYLVTGNIDKYNKLLKDDANNNNNNVKFKKALCLGDIRERIHLLENAGHRPLAYITAAIHGLDKIAERLAAELGDDGVPLLAEGKCPSLVMPPGPITCTSGDWPLLNFKRIATKRLSSAAVADKWDQGEGESSVVDIDDGETNCKRQTSVVVYRRRAWVNGEWDPGWEIVDGYRETCKRKKSSVVVRHRRTRT